MLVANKEYKLLVPITVQGKTTDTITLRRIKIADLREMRKHTDSDKQNEVLLTRIGEITPAEFDEIDAVDYDNLTEVLNDFFEQPKAQKPRRQAKS